MEYFFSHISCTTLANHISWGALWILKSYCFQIAVDLFTLNSQFADIATQVGISKFSGGQAQHFAGYHAEKNPATAAKFEIALR